MSILGELQAFDQGKWVELFVLDATNLGAGLFYFHAGVNELNSNIVWQSNEYVALPITASGFEYNGSKLPRPKLQLANVQGLFSALVKQYNDLVGCKIIRKRTAVKYLDAVNFSAGNPNANPSECLPDEIFYIVQKTAENKITIEFELGSALDLQGVLLPRRQVIATVCPFKYRGEECGYTGGPVANANDVTVGTYEEDRCSKRVSGCKLRFATGSNAFQTGDLPFGGFVGAALLDF